MILSDRDIRAEIDAGRIVIDPFVPDAVQPSSVDLHLGNRFRVFRNNRTAVIDPREEQPELTELVEIAGDEPFILHPGEFVLGATLRAGRRCPTTSSPGSRARARLGRLGLLIHSTAGYVDPGWEGTLTLELSQRRQPADQALRRHEDRPDQLPAPQLAGRGRLRRRAHRQSKYRGQTDPTASRYHADFERGRVVRR